MAKRKTIGIVFDQNESWAGGFYYTLNVIKSLNYLDKNERPKLIIFTSDNKYLQTIKDTGYPNLHFASLFPLPGLLARGMNKILKKKNIATRIYRKELVEFVYPVNYYSSYESLKELKQIYWIPDFQHLHLTENFSAEVIALRQRKIKYIIEKQFDIVFSSFDSKKDFTNTYPEATNKLHVLNFPSILPVIKQENVVQTLLKFNIPATYFLCANQFWKHKNHLQLLRALKLLKDKGINVHVVFTGNMIDYCEKEYVKAIYNFVRENDLTSTVSFLGYIDRMDQLSLIKGAIAVIQPSLFEGWSSIVEDCKALNQFILLSDIAVHKEQIKNNCLFFKSASPTDLADKIQYVLKHSIEHIPINYTENIVAFAKGIINIY